MQCTIKLFAYFRENRFIREERQLPDGTTILEVITSLDIDPEEVGVTMINSRVCPRDQIIHENDQVAIFPTIGGG